MPIATPSNRYHRANNLSTMFDTTILPYNKSYNGCKNSLCYTWSKNFIYKQHYGYGRLVGTTAAGSLAQRRRL